MKKLLLIGMLVSVGSTFGMTEKGGSFYSEGSGGDQGFNYQINYFKPIVEEFISGYPSKGPNFVFEQLDKMAPIVEQYQQNEDGALYHIHLDEVIALIEKALLMNKNNPMAQSDINMFLYDVAEMKNEMRNDANDMAPELDD